MNLVAYAWGMENITEGDEIISIKGDPDDPMSDEDLLGKFHDLADPIIGKGPAIELSEAIDSLGHISGLGEFPVGHR